MFFFLASCSGDRCIDADDFGHTKFIISSRYDSFELDGQVGDNQMAPWLNSDYKVNGRPLTIAVRGWEYGVDKNSLSEVSAWCPWFGSSKESNKLSDICVRLTECQFLNDTMCIEGADAPIINAPCLMKKGLGLYTLIAEQGTDPNGTFTSQSKPSGIVFHVGEKTIDYGMYEVTQKGNLREIGGRVYQFDSEEAKMQYMNSPIYFKIVDKFYDDNNGQYKVIVKSGISRVSPDPITYAIKLVKDYIFGVDGKQGVVKDLYLGIVNKPAYKIAVSALLSLYIIFTGFSYLTGNIKLTQTKLIARVTKIAIVSALINSQYSWSFFNDFLFVYFVGGADQILSIIMEAGASGPGAPGILAMMIAPQTFCKLLSLLFTDWIGFIYIILFFVAICLVFIIFFHSAVIYLSSLIAISLIIIMAPIFICFLLFDFTRSFFENWLKQLLSYAIQPIILFTGLIFISMLIRQELYASLGFSVCRYNILNMSSISPVDGSSSSIFDAQTQDSLNGLTDSLFAWWFPQQMLGSNFSRELKPIPIPIDHFENEVLLGDNSQNTFCEAYGCIGDRYPDLPFLDPVKDIRRLTQFWSGRFVQLDGLFLIFAAIYLLHKFNALTVQAAKFLTGTEMNSVKLNVMANNAVADFMKKISSIAKPIRNQAMKMPRRVANQAFGKERVDKFSQKVSDKLTSITPSYLIDRARVNALKSDALSSNANKAVLREVAINTGLEPSSIKKNATRDYKLLLQKELIKQIDPTLPQFQRENIAKKNAAKLAKKDYSKLKNEFAKMKFGKKFKELSDEQKIEVKAITGSKELKSMARESAKARQFKEAYVDAYINMSDKGMGLVGKNVKAVRSVEQLQNDIKVMKENKSSIYAINNTHKGDILMTGIGNSNYIDTKRSDNQRMLSTAEMNAHNKLDLSTRKLNAAINLESRKKGENVTSPEFIAKAIANKDPYVEVYKDLERKDLVNKIRQTLTNGEDPALKGNLYMSKYAKDYELKNSLDQIAKVEKSFIKNDDYIGRKADHEEKFNIAINNLKADNQKLQDHFNRNNIKPEEMPDLMQKYYNDLNANESAPNFSKEEIKYHIDHIKIVSKSAVESRNVLDQIEARKDQVHKEIDGYINRINNHRKANGMKEYAPERRAIGKKQNF